MTSCLLREFQGVRTWSEQPGVDDPGGGPIAFGNLLIRIHICRVAGKELGLHALELGGDLVVPGRPLDLGHRLGSVAFGDLFGPAVDTDLEVLRAPRQEPGGQCLGGEVGEAQVGAVGPAVVVELGTRVDVELLADVEGRFGIGDAVVDAGNFGKLTRSTPSMSTKSSATTSSSRWAPGLRIAKNSSSWSSVCSGMVRSRGPNEGSRPTVANRLVGVNSRSTTLPTR